MRGIVLLTLLFIGLINIAFSSPQFLMISDIHYGSDNQAKEGEDTGPLFLKNSLKKFKQLSEHVDFILNLGDLPTHSLFASTKKAEYERVLFHELYLADAALKPMFYIPGNNDSLSGNYQPFNYNGQSPLSFAEDWDGACLYCEGLIIDKAHMASGGYYSSYVIPQNKEIILIALNTIPFAERSILLPPYPNQREDAEEELSWLEQQLKQHKAKQLLIAMHIPPGVNYAGTNFWNEQSLKRFIALLNDYAHAYQQITLLSSHTHMDELHKLTLANGVSIYNYYAPSISRNHYNNPGMKIINLNHDMEVANYTTYYTTNLEAWGDEHYQAMGSAHAIFPECTTPSLSSCLNQLSAQQVCQRLEQGLFYGVKSDKTPKNVCQHSYLIH